MICIMDFLDQQDFNKDFFSILFIFVYIFSNYDSDTNHK